MTQTLVQVGMQIVAYITVLVYKCHGILIDNKLLFETTAFRCLVVSIGDIADGDALAAVLSAYPVGIRQIDANGGGWIFVATKHGCTYDIGRHTLDYRLAESWIDR